MHPPDGPPVWTALTVRPGGAPPAISSTIVRIGVPIGTSTRPANRTWPDRENTFVPRLRPEPMAAYQSAPRAMTAGTVAIVSTLLMSVGQPHSPASAGYGGRGCGVPR